MARLAGISIYPVKSLAPLLLQEVRILPSGALEGDRAFALFDSEHRFVNGKRNALVHRLRSKYDPASRSLQLDGEGSPSAVFHVERQRDAIEAWLGGFFGMPISFKHDGDVGFPDDLDCPGPTIISAATLGEVASWFPPLDASQLRLRFRANLEIADVPAFWEDRLYGEKGSPVRFRIGGCLFEGNNPCHRCVVPPRDPATGEAYPNFAKIFVERRRQTLPAWAERSRFNHFYRLAINTIVPPNQAGKSLRVGDEVEILNAP